MIFPDILRRFCRGATRGLRTIGELRREDSVIENVREQLLRIIEEEVTAVREIGFEDGPPAQKRIDDATARLAEVAREDPRSLQRLASEVNPSSKDYFDSRRATLLIKALDRVDSTGELLCDLVAKDDSEIHGMAVDCLAARGQPQLLRPLIPLLEHPQVGREVRHKILKALVKCGVKEACPVTKRLPANFVRYGGRELLSARGSLGDETALRELIEQVYAESSTPGLVFDALRALMDHLGGVRGTVSVLLGCECPNSLADGLRELAHHDDAPTVRIWAISELVRLPESEWAMTLFDCLTDEDWRVVSRASEALTRMASRPIERLRSIAYDHTAQRDRRLWAIYMLLRWGIPVDSLLARIPGSRISLPESITPQMREAAVRHWAANPGKDTDVRWLIENQQLPKEKSYDYAAVVKALTADLRTAGIQLGAQEFSDDDRHDHICVMIPVEGDDVCVSKLGLFACYVATLKDYHKGRAAYIYPSMDPDEIAAHEPSDEKIHNMQLCRSIAELHRLTWLDLALGSAPVPGLCGSSSPIGSLLFQLICWS